MIELCPHWQRPFFIILLPIFGFLLWKLWHLNSHKGIWQHIIPTTFQPWLLRGVQGKESITPKLFITFTSILAILALLGPSWKHIKQPPLKLDAPLVIVVDMTPRVLSNDLPPNRLENVKRKLLDIISARHDAQTAIIVYAGSAHIVAPLSDDKDALNNLIKVLSPRIMPKFGENAETGIAKAVKLVDNTRQNGKIRTAEILLVTTGLNDQEQNRIKQILARKSINLDILGVGTAQGAPILIDGAFLKDQAGNIITSKLDSSNLQKLANTEGGYYSTMTLNNADINALHLANPKGDKRLVDEKDMRLTNLWQEQGYWFILPILLIAAFAGRKGWLLCIPLFALSLQPKTANAFEWNQLWLNKNQQGEKLLKEHRPKEAANTFQDKQWQSYAAYEAKNYQKAEKQFAKSKTPESTYNYGNALARQGKYQEAIVAWDKAIKDKPNFEQAIVNKKIIEELLKKQEQEQQQNNQQDNQQQNQDNQQQNQNQQPNADSSSKNDSQSQQGKQQNTEQQNSEQQSNEQANNDQNQKQSSSSNQASSNSENKQNGSSSPSKTDENNDDMPSSENSSSSADNEQTTNTPVQQDKQLDKAKQQTTNEPKGQSSNTLEEGSDIDKQERQERLLQQLPESEDPSELLRRKFYFEQRYNKGDY